MPVTITLTDDQALEIMAQIGGMLRKGPADAPPPADAKHRFFAKVQGMKKGELLFTNAIIAEYKSPQSTVSSWLDTAKRAGQIEMVKRGTWVKK